MIINLHLGEQLVSLKFKSFDDEVDTDELLSVQYDNLYADAITAPALCNKLGLLKSESESLYSQRKLKLDIYEAQRRKEIRKEFVNSGQKLTEKQLEEEITLDKVWQSNKNEVIKGKRDLDFIDSLYFAAQDKSRKLNVLIKGVTPEELAKEIIEGTINNIVIKKHKSILDK